MRVTYGDVELQMVHLRDVTKTPRFSEDGSTYLWTDYRIDMVCIYNPRSTSYASAAGVPVPGAGANAFETDVALESYLSQPRRRLRILTATGDVWLVAPRVGYTVDNNNGPRCTVCSIVQPTGTLKTFEVHVIFEASVNGCYQDRVLLSHRWRRYCDVNEDFFTTITTEGDCVFNQAELVKRGWNPDDFRVVLFHPIPDYYKRERIDVVPGSDGFTYRYRTVDVEQAYSLGANCPATRVEAYKTVRFYKKNLNHSLFASGGLSTTASTIGTVGSVAGSLRRRVGPRMWFMADAVISAMPRYTLVIQVRVWGNRHSTRKALRHLGYSIVLHHIDVSVPNTALGGGINRWALTGVYEVTEDIAGKFVEVNRTLDWGAEHEVEFSTFDPSGAPTTVEKAFVQEVLSPPLVGHVRNPTPLGGAFGSAPLLEMIHQALSSPCSLPPNVPSVATVSGYGAGAGTQRNLT